MKLLESIKSQTYKNFETIFVIERSQQLYQALTSYANEHPLENVKILFTEKSVGLSGARNIGIRVAQGEIIGFVDDDVVLSPEWAKRLVDAYADDSLVGVTGPALPLWEDKSMCWIPLELYWLISCTNWCGWEKVTEVRNAWGHNMSFTRLALVSCGMFSEQTGYHKGLIAEDNEFSMRVRLMTGKRIIYDPDIKVWHAVQRYRLSWRFVTERGYWIGRSRCMLKKLYTKNHQNILLTESDLLKRILTSLVPNILKDCWRNPVLSWKKISVTSIAVFSVIIGYLDIKLFKF